jgi:hypothetical protein
MIKNLRLYLEALFIGLTIFLLTGCANVDPWDRNILAKESMTLQPDPLGSAMRDHVDFSREGTQGATRSGGGGCGCN